MLLRATSSTSSGYSTSNLSVKMDLTHGSTEEMVATVVVAVVEEKQEDYQLRLWIAVDMEQTAVVA